MSPAVNKYGLKHRALRKRWAPKVARGEVNCARCHKPIKAGEPWDLGHDDHDASRYNGPEHRDCNRATHHRKELRPCRNCSRPTRSKYCAICAKQRDNARRHAKQKAHGRATADWQRLRREVINRDGGRCRTCGAPARSVHLAPALNGRHDLATAADCVLLCARCHGIADAPRSSRSSKPRHDGTATTQRTGKRGGRVVAKVATTAAPRGPLKLPPPGDFWPQRRQSQVW